MIRRRHVCLLALVTALAAAVPVASATAAQEPASASVNVCGGSGTGDIGVRVNAPFRGDDVAPWVRITIQYFDDGDGGWHAASNGDSGWFQAGPQGTGAETGYTFPYRAPDKGSKLVLRGVAEVEWRAGGDDDQFITSSCVVDGPKLPS
jgi:hypothetical protein